MKAFYRVCIVFACVFIILGLVLSIVSLALGGRLLNLKSANFRTGSFSEEYTDVTSLNFDFAASDVKIVTGDENVFKIDGKNVPIDYFYSEVEDGVWTIGHKKFRNSLRSIFSYGFNYNIDTTIEITLPKDHSLKQVTIEGGASSIEIECIKADSISFEIGAGEIKVDNMHTNKLKSETGVGDTKIKGKVNGDIEIDCDVGNVDLELKNDIKDFNYYIDVSIGSVTIDNKDMSSASKSEIFYNADYDLKVSCDIGNVTIDFD